MNHCVTDWIMEDGSMSFHDLLPSAGLKRSTRPENELVELLWQNGHVVMHSQTNRKATTPNEIKQCQKPESVAKYVGPLENSTNVIHDGEMVSWLQYPDDSLEKEFYTDIFYGLPTTESTTMDKLKDVIADEDKFTNYGATEESNIFAPSKSQQPINHQFEENVMPPPKSQVAASYTKTASAGSAGVTNFSHFSRPPKAVLQPLNGQLGEKSSGDRIQGEVGESSSVMTKGSSFCGSNQVQNPFDVSWSNAVTVPSAKGVEEESQTRFSQGRAHSDIHETAVTSSSGGSGCSYGRTGQQSGSMRSHKRKGRDADESECQSEEDVDESVEANRPAQRSANARRSRAAEVHNLSERRRRDRINEKMRALQELIPHSNKTDKASMLDEAIEYLKSLQLQVQMMWMGSGMTPMMFPGVQHFMSRMGMGMGHGPVPSIHGPIQFPRVPLVGQSLSSNPSISQTSVCPSPGISPVSFQSQVQNAHLPESYARYLGFQHMQPSPQAMNLYAYGSQLLQQNKTTPAAGGGAACDGGTPPENFPNVRTS